MKKKYKYIIIGGGVSGLTTAYELSLTNPGEVLILEKESEPGGLCKTVIRNNCAYDLGSHRIHYNTSQKILDYFKSHSDSPLIKKKRGGTLIFKNKFIDYPIKSFQFIFSLGIIESFLCSLSLLKAKLIHYFHKNRNIDYTENYQSYLQRKAGNRVYKLFYEPYAVKVWGCDPGLISDTAVKKRMSMIRPISFIKDIVNHYLKKQPNDYYYYLEDGIGSFSKGLEKKLLHNQVKIITNVDNFIIKIHNNKRIIEINNKSNVQFENIISTIPIDDLVNSIHSHESIDNKSKNCLWRGLKLVFLQLDSDILPPGETFYFPETTHIFGRVSIPGRFSPLLQKENDCTAVVCEIPCSKGDIIWNMEDKEVFKKCHTDLQKAGLISPETHAIIEKSFVKNISKVYPVYVLEWKKRIEDQLRFLNNNFPFIYASGKPGFFLHNNMDHSIEIGIQAAEAFKKNISNKEWHNNLSKFHSMKLRD